MKPELNGTTTRQSGDINFIAALMSQGIPLDVVQPLTIVGREDGSNYASYRYGDVSEDGTLSTETLIDSWNGEHPLPTTHGFSQVCDFIRSRPRGVQRTDDLLDYAVTYLRGHGYPLPGLRALKDVPTYVNALPDGEASYVLAYVWNREICYQLHRQATHQIHMTEGSGKDTRHALLDTKLPRWKSRELLSRLQN